MNNNNMIDKDVLIRAVAAVDDMDYIIQELADDYFNKYKPENRDDNFCILYGFKRYRAYIDILLRLIHSVKKDFTENGISCYD